jgi:hypothetical protein
MAANEEYEAQRAGLHFFAHIARQQGIEVGVPHTSDLFTPRFAYGFDEQTHSFVKMRARKAELEQRLMAAQQVFEQKMTEMNFLKGALDDLNYCFQTWADKGEYLEPPEIGAFVALQPAAVVPIAPTPEQLGAVAASASYSIKGNGADGMPIIAAPSDPNVRFGQLP